MSEAGHHEDGEAAGRLIRCGLTPHERPARNPDYAELLRRYRSEPTFQRLTDAFAKGIGLVVLDTGDYGMVLGASEGSPFAWTLTDYRRQTLGPEDRVCHGLIQLAVAAYCFPTAVALDDPHGTIAKFTTNQIVRYLIDLCEELKRSAPGDASEELQEAWRVILSRCEARTTPDQRRAASTIQGMVAHALKTLEKSGLLRRQGDDEGGRWATTNAYRVQVRELGAFRAFALVQDATRRRTA